MYIPKEPNFSPSEKLQCENAISKLIEKGAISKCLPHANQFISSYFLRDKPDGSKRFILNLKKLNNFIKAEHFKMEDRKTVTFLLERSDYLATIDLHDAFFLVPVHVQSRKYLRFVFQNILYEFCCLPFGLNVSPYVFTKILKPAFQFLRSQKLRSVVYLDDILMFGRTKRDCEKNIEITKDLLESLGFILNMKKCNLNPSNSCEYLGFDFDSVKYCISLTDKKRKKLLNLVDHYRKKTKCKIREWAQFVGNLIAAAPAVKYSFVYIKSLERCKYVGLLKHNGNYDENLCLSDEVYEDLNWWIRQLPTAVNPIRSQNYTIEIFSDASTTGWGIYCNDIKSRGWWSDEEKTHHINFLELKAAYYGLLCFAKDLRSCEILLRIDNTTAISYINKSGSIQFPKLSALSKKIWKWCEDRNLYIFASYIKSSNNIEADEQSRLKSEETEWSLAEYAFKKIHDRFGPFDVDLFASNINAKCENFYSWFPDPEAIAIDAFTVSWSNIYFYAFPPFSLILRTLRKICVDKAKGILVVPYWPTQAWFPMFLNLRISKIIYFKPNKTLISSPFRDAYPTWQCLTLVAAALSGDLSITEESLL